MYLADLFQRVESFPGVNSNDHWWSFWWVGGVDHIDKNRTFNLSLLYLADFVLFQQQLLTKKIFCQSCPVPQSSRDSLSEFLLLLQATHYTINYPTQNRVTLITVCHRATQGSRVWWDTMQDKLTIDVPGLDWRLITRLDMHLEIGRPTQHQEYSGRQLNILSFLLFSFSFSPAHATPDTVANTAHK